LPGHRHRYGCQLLVNIAVPNIHPDAKIVAVLPLEPGGQAALKDQLAKEIQQNAAMVN